MPYLYIETDGEVYLVQKQGVWTFPQKDESLPFEIKEIVKMPLKQAEVIFCRPILNKHPKWTFKDDIPGMDNVDKIVRIAVNLSLVRHFSSAVIIKDKKILLLKSARGITKGLWHFPGGFVDYPAHPEDSVKRECIEEINVKVKVKELIGVYTNVFGSSMHYALGFPYISEIESGEITPNPEEVADMKWVTLDEGIKITKNPFVKWTLEKLKSRGGSAW